MYSESMGISRRDVLKISGAAIVAGPGAFQAAPKPLPTRPLGRTGWHATLYAIGTAELPDTETAVRALRALLDAGVNYVDTAPSYQNGRSEVAVGQALRDRRDRVFVATKTLARDADGAYEEVRASLKRLDLSYVDCLQIHAVNDMGTLDRVLGRRGAVAGLERARREGLVRFIGITGHTRPEVISKAIERYPFASILVPTSTLDKHLSDFAEETIPLARAKGIAVIGMKALKGMEIATRGRFQAADLIRYALSLPVDTLAIGLRRPSEVEDNLRIVRDFRPMSPRERKALEDRLRPYATADHLWWKRR